MAMRVEDLTKNPATYTIRPKVVEKPVVPLDAPEQKLSLIHIFTNAHISSTNISEYHEERKYLFCIA